MPGRNWGSHPPNQEGVGSAQPRLRKTRLRKTRDVVRSGPAPALGVRSLTQQSRLCVPAADSLSATRLLAGNRLPPPPKAPQNGPRVPTLRSGRAHPPHPTRWRPARLGAPAEEGTSRPGPRWTRGSREAPPTERLDAENPVTRPRGTPRGRGVSGQGTPDRLTPACDGKPQAGRAGRQGIPFGREGRVRNPRRADPARTGADAGLALPPLHTARSPPRHARPPPPPPGTPAQSRQRDGSRLAARSRLGVNSGRSRSKATDFRAPGRELAAIEAGARRAERKPSL